MSDPSPVVFVVDDDASVRDALSSLLRSVGLGVETFGSAREFLARQPPDAPGCLVLDVRLPGLSGLDLQRELAAAQVTLPVIFLTGHGDIPMTVRAMKAGAVEFLTKPFRDQELLDAIQQAIERDRVARQQGAELAALRQRYAALTPRERDVMQRVVAGRLNKQIAADLGTSEITVKVHRGQVAQDARGVLGRARPDGRTVGPPHRQVLGHLYQRIMDFPPHRPYVSPRSSVLPERAHELHGDETGRRGRVRQPGWRPLGPYWWLPQPYEASMSEIPLIAVVDDDAAVREAVQSLLRSAGLRAEEFASAQDFLQSGRLQDTACLIVDVRMPRMGGLELQRQLATARRPLPIIFTTAHGDAEARARALRAGAVAFLDKPFGDEVSHGAVQAALQPPRGGG